MARHQRIRTFPALAALAGLAIVSGADPAAACTPITSIPLMITAPGSYCLTGNLSTAQTSGDAITVASGYVTIDLQGYEIAGTGALSGTAHGIRSWAQTDVTVRNGTIRGFFTGVSLEGAFSGGTPRNLAVEDLRVIGSAYTGIRVTGQNCSIARNKVLQIGGSTTVGSYPTFTGIFVYGSNNVIEKNDVAGFVTTSGSANLGILVNPSSNSLIEGNRIIGATTAIHVGHSAAVEVVGNRIWQGTRGIEYVLSSGKYRDNLTLGVSSPYYGGTDAGNND